MLILLIKLDDHWAYSGLDDFDGYRDLEKAWLEKEVGSEAFQKARFRVLLTYQPIIPSESYGMAQCRGKMGGVVERRQD